jgi:hypothetical protein
MRSELRHRTLPSIVAVILLTGCQALLTKTAPSDFLVSFERGPCFGTCPVYVLTVLADGTVSFNGVRFVLAEGTQTATFSPQQVTELYQAVLDADFFDLEDRYEVAATDLPSILTTITMNGQIKTVYHYGLGCGTELDLAPPGLCALEALLESIPSANAWVSDN